MPRAMPPCGGAPNSNASSRWPNCSCACSELMPSAGTWPTAARGGGYGYCHRPLPSRPAPGHTPWRGTLPVSFQQRPVLIRAEVKGWCMAVQRCSSSFQQREIHHPAQREPRDRSAPSCGPASRSWPRLRATASRLASATITTCRQPRPYAPQARQRRLAQEFGDRRRVPSSLRATVTPLGPVTLRLLAQFVHLLAAELGAPGANTALTCRRRPAHRQTRRIRCLPPVAEVYQFHPKAQVRLIHPVASPWRRQS